MVGGAVNVFLGWLLLIYVIVVTRIASYYMVDCRGRGSYWRRGFLAFIWGVGAAAFTGLALGVFGVSLLGGAP
jgi:hypothetical protein